MEGEICSVRNDVSNCSSQSSAAEKSYVRLTDGHTDTFVIISLHCIRCGLMLQIE